MELWLTITTEYLFEMNMNNEELGKKSFNTAEPRRLEVRHYYTTWTPEGTMWSLCMIFYFLYTLVSFYYFVSRIN